MTQSTKKQPALIVGATSDIALALAKNLAGQGHPLYLAARRPEDVEANCSDLNLRHNVDVSALRMDVTDVEAIGPALAELNPPPHIIVSMVGDMGVQAEQERDVLKAGKVIASNFSGPAALMEEGAKILQTIDAPTTLVGVSSVAGDRGRARNYYYGASKAAFTSMLSGLRQRLVNTQTTVITVKPGFVATRMTEGMDLPGPLVDSAEKSAEMIARAIRKRREIVYPWKWRILMTAIRAVPETIFKRLKF